MNQWCIFLYCLVSTELNSSDEEEEKSEQSPDAEIVDSWFPDQAFAANKNILIEVEELEEKIFAASLQVKVYLQFPVIISSYYFFVEFF